jgi:hypothetical protein
MFEVLVDGVWVERDPVTGDTARQWFGEGDLRHYIKYDSYVKSSSEEQAKEWRNSELKRTDWIVPVTDHTQHADYMAYRQALRDWPSTPDFPDTRPTLGI